ncbi:hypothetical protein PJJ30_24175 [Mycobacterium kansasii]
MPFATKIPDVRPEKFGRVSRAGGRLQSLVTDSARLLVELWVNKSAGGSVAAELLCCDAIAALQNAQGTTVGGVFIRGFTNIDGPVDFPDPEVTDMERWQFQGDWLVSTS